MPLVTLGANAGWVNVGNPNTVQLQVGGCEIVESNGAPATDAGFVLLPHEMYVIEYTQGGTLWVRSTEGKELPTVIMKDTI